jgi:hypothetical protein
MGDKSKSVLADSVILSQRRRAKDLSRADEVTRIIERGVVNPGIS